MLANRIAWAFVRGVSTWEITKTLDLCSSISIIYDMLSQLDQMIHEHSYCSRLTYAELLDQVKVNILSKLPNSISTKVI